MKTTLPAALLLLLFFGSCTKSGNTISPTNTITLTVGAGTPNAETLTLNSVPSTTTLANGTPFYITGTGTGVGAILGNTAYNIAISLNNPNCSYPNFVSGTYNLCNNDTSLQTNPPLTPCTCTSGTNNSIELYSNNPAIKSNNGTVVANFNNGTATGTFSYNAYYIRTAGYVVGIDTFSVTGSFNVSY